MWKILGLLVLAAVCVVLVLAWNKPDSFRVERSALVPAPPERVFALINDLERMNAWNPWQRKDPALRGTYGASRAGPGAHYAWDGDKVGAGSMTITESSAPNRLVMRLDFLKPFKAVNQAEFTLEAEGAGTRVTWAMTGPTPFISKLMQVVINFDQMIGRDFEDGLANLKQLAAAG